MLSQIKTVIGESPVWNAKSNSILWVEAAGKSAFQYDLTNRVVEEFHLPFEVTAVVPCDNSDWIFASKQGLFYSNAEFDHYTPLGDPCSNESALHLNDAVANPNGELWFGSLNCDDLNAPDGKLYKLTKQTISELDGGFSVANGIAFNFELKRAYCSNMFQRKVYEYQLDESMTRIIAKQVFIELNQEEGFPDGLCVDKAGNLYVCHWDSGLVSYYQPSPTQLGQAHKLGQLVLPVKHATRCTFGGPDYETLFVTTAHYQLSDHEAQCYPRSGELFILDAPTSGKPEAQVDARLLGLSD